MREVYLFIYMRDRSRREYSYFRVNFGAGEMLQVSTMIVLLCKKLRIKYDMTQITKQFGTHSIPVIHRLQVTVM